MSISDRKIGEWQHPIVDELDKPVRSASEMKTVFDSNSNELKAAVNGLIDDLLSQFAELASVAYSASYNDLVDAPIPLNGTKGQTLRLKTTGSLELEWAYGSGSVEQIQADYTDENPLSLAYVRNRPIIAENVVVDPSAFSLDADETCESCPYKALVTVEDVTASMNRAEVTFAEDDRYMFAGIAKLTEGGVEIYASFIPAEAITIPTIVVWR